MMDRKYKLALALSGGNALGSWQAGAVEVMAERGYLPDRVSGASIGAVNGAMFVGNPPDEAIKRLRAFWSPTEGAPVWWPAGPDTWHKTAAVSWALAMGRPDAFMPRPFFGQPWAGDGAPSPSLFDTHPLRATLESSVDWNRINDGRTRFTATAVDLETGLDAAFDTAHERLGPEHVRASTALMPAFPPVEIDGRWYVDPGLSANLPLDALLGEPGPEPLLMIALDLLPVAAPQPRTIGEAAGRLQDLIFAGQARRTIDAWRAVYELHGARAPAVTLVRLIYADQSREVAGKAFDFSGESAAQRWNAGRAAATALLDALDAGQVEIGRPGLAVHQGTNGPEPAGTGFRLSRNSSADDALTHVAPSTGRIGAEPAA